MEHRKGKSFWRKASYALEGELGILQETEVNHIVLEPSPEARLYSSIRDQDVELPS